jgi:uncharacterized protein (DUF1015 family)
MAVIKPFAALRPRPDLAREICELPYDVLSSAEACEQAQGRPLSFFHVSKPEIDLPGDTDPYSPRVYAKARENFLSLIRDGALHQDAKPAYYFYRQIMGSHSQTGLVAAASCDAYLQGIIKKHEFTRLDKEDDRVRHIEALDSQTGPVFLTYRADAAFDMFVKEKTALTPDVDFTARDGVRHTAWTVTQARDIEFVDATFARIPALYIADGHHRSAAAARVFQARCGSGESGGFLSVIFPHSQMRILPYNRVLRGLNGMTPEQLLARLKDIFDIEAAETPEPAVKHQVGFYFQGGWRRLRFHASLTRSPDPIERLDVTLLQKNVLAPLFGIDDPRTSKQINFIGGIRGTGELVKRVDSGEYACAFALYPTGIEDLMSIADAGGIMPPKSTWFEPKLRDGLFSHLI